jgi:hypothetical protein
MRICQNRAENKMINSEQARLNLEKLYSQFTIDDYMQSIFQSIMEKSVKEGESRVSLYSCCLKSELPYPPPFIESIISDRLKEMGYSIRGLEGYLNIEWGWPNEIALTKIMASDAIHKHRKRVKHVLISGTPPWIIVSLSLLLFASVSLNFVLLAFRNSFLSIPVQSEIPDTSSFNKTTEPLDALSPIPKALKPSKKITP